MIDFQYQAPRNVDEAVSLLARANGGGVVLAGGTDVLVQLREHRRNASLVVDIKRIPELNELKLDGTGLTLGAAVPAWRVHEHRGVAAAYPALADAARIIGAWQIQSRASVGGNLCNSSPAADSIPPLMVHGAVAQVAGPQGRRERPVATFCTGPGRNILERGEILVAIKFPAATPKSGSAYLRFIPRNEMDIAVVGAAAWVQLDNVGERIVEARIALSAVAPTPVMAEAAAQSLAGQIPSAERLEAAGQLARQVASPISDMRGPAEYRHHLVGVLVKRTLAKAIERARQ